MPGKIPCGDFYQLPPVPASASLLAPHSGQSYEHQQGRKLLADFECVVDFVQMQRFTDPLQLEVLYAVRTPGGKKISEESWQAIVKTEVVSPSDAGQPAASSSQAAQPPQWDHRLRAARGWYESAYEWCIVSYVMHRRPSLTRTMLASCSSTCRQSTDQLPASQRPTLTRCARSPTSALLHKCRGCARSSSACSSS